MLRDFFGWIFLRQSDSLHGLLDGLLWQLRLACPVSMNRVIYTEVDGRLDLRATGFYKPLGYFVLAS